MAAEPDALLAALRAGAHGVRLVLPERLELQREDALSARLRDPDTGVTWFVMFEPDLHLDLKPTRRDQLRTSAAHYARQMFIDAGRADAHEPNSEEKGALRTDDASWSPLVDLEIVDVAGIDAARIVHRMLYRAGRELMMGHLLIPCADGLLELRVVALDGTTGYREAALIAMQAALGSGEHSQLGMPQSTFDAPEHDAAFEGHCLSRVRRALDEIAADVVLSANALPSRPPGPALPPGPPGEPERSPALGGTIVVPKGFVHVPRASEPNLEFYTRACFCVTDGVERLFVERDRAALPKSRALVDYARKETQQMHEEADVQQLTLSTIEHSADEVTVIVDGQGHQGALHNVLHWTLGPKRRPHRVSIVTTNIGEAPWLVDEVREAAASWVYAPAPWWRFW